MAERGGTLALLGRELALILLPLERRLTRQNVLGLFAELGVSLPAALLDVPAFTDALNRASVAAGMLEAKIGHLSSAITAGDPIGIAQRTAEIIGQVRAVITALEDVGEALQSVSSSLPDVSTGEIADFARNLSQRLVEFLVGEYLEARFPVTVGALALLGLIERSPGGEGPGGVALPAFVVRRLRPDRLAGLLRNPETYVEAMYGWGRGDFDGRRLLANLELFLGELGLTTRLEDAAANGRVALKGSLFDLQVEPDTVPPGMGLVIHVRITETEDVGIPLGRPGVSLRLRATGQFLAGIEATVTPPATFSLKPPSGTVEGELAIGIQGEGGSSPFVLLGLPGGSRLEAETFRLALGFKATWDAAAARAIGEPTACAGISRGRAIIDTSAGDGFLAEILGGARLEAPVDVQATWTLSEGARFEGGVDLATDLPAYVAIGPVELLGLHLKAQPLPDGGLPVEISASVRASLGPLTFTIDRLGFDALLRFPEHGGNLGPVDFAIGFKPPAGAGVAIDAGVVVGGGFLAFDRQTEQYTGMLQLEIAEQIAVTGIGVLTTRLPDGTRGFSLLVMLTAEGFAPIQLGFGLMLTGIGGLLGINRTVALPALQTGLKTGVLDAVLFPPDPVATAGQIISSLSQVFPPVRGRHVVGPMVRLAWGTPALVRGELALVLELPAPSRLTILGQLASKLPSEEKALIQLQVDVLGIVDFERRTLAVDAALRDSRARTPRCSPPRVPPFPTRCPPVLPRTRCRRRPTALSSRRMRGCAGWSSSTGPCRSGWDCGFSWTPRRHSRGSTA